jgi:inorganic pyrophosphatase
MDASELNVNLAVVVPGVLGILWSGLNWGKVNAVELCGQKKDLSVPLKGGDEADAPDALERMIHVGKLISDGAMSFLVAEYQYLAVFTVVFSVLVTLAASVQTAVAFVVGAVTSTICGYLGMKIATAANLKTAHECWGSCKKGYDVAIWGGSVMGLSLVSIGLLVLFGLIIAFKQLFKLEETELYEAVAGYGLGGSAIALFGRVGGGIYTKAADVGADLSGKIDEGMDEDDVRNPACIADNVGDNVGDIAGMGADLFGSFAESTCAALVIGSATGSTIQGNWAATMFPLLISSTGVVCGIITLVICGVIYNVDKTDKVEGALKGILIVSTVIETPLVYLVAVWTLPADGFYVDAKMHDHPASPLHACYPIWMGLWSGLLIGFVTEYYTSFSYQPVRDIALQQKTSAATGIIFGLAVGYMSCIVPVFCIAATVLVAHNILGMYGVALGALGMLSTITMGLTIDAYGPISDNAGGIAEMSGLSHNVRKITDALDAAGNTTAAIGKGFAIGSAALVSLALFGAFTVRAEVQTVDALDPWTFTGLLLGAMIPYAFAALTMRSVAFAATEMVEECRRQFKLILHPEAGQPAAQPDYERCIKISTIASLKEMILPGLLVMISPIAAGFVLGKNGTAGILIGGMISAVQMAISMSNTGGAWDNAKKYAEKEGLKGSEQYKNAVIGDTVGDPMKDTSGPALNIVMKLSAIISLVFGAAINSWSTPEGGPLWLEKAFPSS